MTTRAARVVRLRRASLVALVAVPLFAVGCGEGLAGKDTGDGGGGGDAGGGMDAAPGPDGGMDGGHGSETGPSGDSGASCGTCSSGQVCCEPPLGCAGMCVPDCRQGGTCPQNLACNQMTGVCSPSGDGGMMPPADGGMMPPPDGGMMPPPDGGMMPPPDGGSSSCGTCPSGDVCCEAPLMCAGMCVPDCRTGGMCPMGLTCNQATGVCSPGGDGGMMPPPDGGMKPPPDGGMMPPPDGGGGSDGGSGGSDAGDGSGAAPPGIGFLQGDGTGTYSPYSGNNVSIDDTTIVLGDSQANCISGHARVYVWDGVSSWQLQQTFDDPAMNSGTNCYGGSTAVKGDVAFVASTQGASFEGEVYEYTRSGTTWTQASTIVDSTFNGLAAEFGYALAYDGTHLIAGAPALQNSTATYVGRVDVFTKGNLNWNLQKGIYAPVQTGSSCFGTSVAMNGTRLAVGANGGPHENYSIPGAAYTYVVSGSTWNYEAGAVGQDTQATDGFGQSVALAAGAPNLMIVGAPGASPIGAQSGAAYVFYLDGSTSQWVQNVKLVPSDGAAGDRFGYTVGAISSTQVVVGARGASKAYLFTYAGGQTWNQTTIYQSCPTTIGWNMATWGTLLVTGKASDVVIDTSLTNPGCGGN